MKRAKMKKSAVLLTIVSISVTLLCIIVLTYFIPTLNLLGNNLKDDDTNNNTFEPSSVVVPSKATPDVQDPIQIDDSVYQMKNLSGLVQPDTTNILLIGADQDSDGSDARFDTMVICSIDEEAKTISLISVPRDTYVEYDSSVIEALRKADYRYPHSPGMYKLNCAYFVGRTIKYNNKTLFKNSGMNFVHDIFLQKYGIDFTDYVYVDFNGFKDVVDAMGGLDVTLDYDLRVYHEDTGVVELAIPEGRWHLNGDQVLLYARNRHLYDQYGNQLSTTGDSFRKQNQLKLLVEMSRQLVTPANILKAPEILNSLQKTVYNSIGASDIAKFTNIAMEFTKGHYKLQTYLVIGTDADPMGDGADYVIVN
ncbi:MAG: LCP family protein [Clostridiales bacterium]|jgi:LCP family protein required for cell wall assembly|nr:LCP family protein [Clostridiales bacterium]